MAISLKTVDFQRALDALKTEVKKFRGGKHALVGIHEDAGMVEGEQMTEAELGALQHFGTDGPPKIPARPWLDVGVVSGQRDYIEYVVEQLGKGSDLDTVIEGVGILAAGAAQQYITDLKTPPNSPYTIAKKGSDNPLIDTGRMRASVTSTTTDETPTEGLG
jgi:phage gpG-like protein